MKINNNILSTIPDHFPSWIVSVIYLDHAFSIRINRASRNYRIQKIFSIISRIGDGSIWYISGILLPLYTALFHSLDLAITQFIQLALFAVTGLSIYKLIKLKTSRPRPFVQHSEIFVGCAPLDKWSFPSGHTLHAVGNTILLCYYVPELIFLYLPFTLLVAVSRVILGLHFPSDVLTGATIGAIISCLLLFI